MAERTKAATEEIDQTIRSIQVETRNTLQVMETSRDEVKVGIGETSKARQSLTVIIDAAKEVDHMVQLIAAAATQQTAASEEISESAASILSMATENSQAAEEASAACDSLAKLAVDLDNIIRQFRLAEERQAQSYRAAVSRPALSSSYRPAAGHV